MFELAEEGDIRGFIQKTEVANDYRRLLHLRSVSVGLQQLHSNQICHQDLKPANVLIFKEDGAKIGDLGRASRKATPASQDFIDIPGDRRYRLENAKCRLTNKKYEISGRSLSKVRCMKSR